MLLACDPGVKFYGLAWFDHEKLVRARLVPAAELHLERFTYDRFVLERQYVTFKHPRPQDIVELSFAAGYAKGLFDGVPCQEVLPVQWKGSVPKKIHQKRIISRLSPEEIEILSRCKFNHNVVDAVGIGLFALGRLQRKP